MSVVCCPVEFSMTGRSLVQRNPTRRGVSGCEREAWTLRRSCPNRVCQAMGKGGDALLTVWVPPFLTSMVSTSRHIFCIFYSHKLIIIFKRTCHWNSSRTSSAQYTPLYYVCFQSVLINPLNTKSRLLYLKTQFVPRSKHFSSQL